MSPPSKIQLCRSLTLGLILVSRFLAPSFAASIPRRDNADIPRSAIALKLSNPGTGLLGKVARDAVNSGLAALSGAELVEALIQEALPESQITKRDAEFTVLPLITTISPDDLSEMAQRAVTMDPTYVPTNFSSWFQVQFPDITEDQGSEEAIRLLDTLAKYPEVASCQKLGGLKLPSKVEPKDDPKFPEQGYLTAANVGINAQYAWGFAGGDGAGTTVIDVERGWKLDHEDLVCGQSPRASAETERGLLAD